MTRNLAWLRTAASSNGLDLSTTAGRRWAATSSAVGVSRELTGRPELAREGRPAAFASRYTRTVMPGCRAACANVGHSAELRWKLNVEQVTDWRACSTRWATELVSGPLWARWPGIVQIVLIAVSSDLAPSIARSTDMTA